EGLQAPLIGRDVELSLLDTIYSRVTGEHRPHLITILGTPGIGKTRLAREFIASVLDHDLGEQEPLQRARLLEGRCPQYGEAVTYWPLAEMLRSLADFTTLDPPATARAKLLETVRNTLYAAGRLEDPEVLAAYLGYTIGIETTARRRALLPSDGQRLQEH